MKLDFPKSNNFCKPIKDLMAKLSKKFEITKSSDLEKAVELSTYLLAIRKNQESEDLLKSFIYEIKYDTRSYSWGHRNDGLSVLAFMYYTNGEFDLFKQAVSDLISVNFDKNDFDWLIDQAEDDLEYYSSERIEFKEIEEQLTEKK